jgi:membrane fusion protein, multidrug efflux system
MRGSFVSLFVIALCAGTLAGCGQDDDASDRPAKRVRVQAVAFMEASEKQTYTGVVRARVEAPLAFRVGGKIEKRFVDVGAQVKAGDVLLELDRTDFELNLKSAEANLKAAQARAEQLGDDEERFKALRLRGHVSESSYDKASTDYRTAMQQFESAKAAATLARHQLDYTRLEADADGVMTMVSAEVGQVVPSGQPVAMLAKSGERDVVIAVPESRVEGVASLKGQVSFWSKPDAVYAAKVREVAPQADPVTRTYAVRLTLMGDGVDAGLGQTAQVTLLRPVEGKVASVPLSALWYKGEVAHVWVADKAQKRLSARGVNVVLLKDDVALVRDGVVEGDLVVTMGVHRLDDQLPIVIEQVQP